MILSKSFVGSRVIFASCRILSFQGHYVNKLVDDARFHCQCHGNNHDKRTFFTFPKASRTREYTGRQLVGWYGYTLIVCHEQPIPVNNHWSVIQISAQIGNQIWGILRQGHKLKHTMEQMFEVVSDVENYHKFVPWCKKSIVLKRSTDALQADLIVGFPPINESYTSRVTLVKPHLVKAECTDGKLFHHLLTLWRFSPGLKREQQSCVVDFHITFEFRSAFHSNLSNLFFDQVARQMEGAFIKEVGKRYGPASMQPRNLLLNSHALKS